MKNSNYLTGIWMVAMMVLVMVSLYCISENKKSAHQDLQLAFGEDYKYAVDLLQKNRWWNDSLTKHGIDAKFALAIVFPELIRYSSILDYIETKSLEVLYVQYGETYADFSIGYFQMKPSFAEKLESDLSRLGIMKEYPLFDLLKTDKSDDPGERKDRVMRLKEEYFQLLYLEAFIRVMEKMYKGEFSSMSEKLAFYSTAYNTGYFKGSATIRNEMQTKRFYVGHDPEVKRYSYHQLAEYFFSNDSDR